MLDARTYILDDGTEKQMRKNEQVVIVLKGNGVHFSLTSHTVFNMSAEKGSLNLTMSICYEDQGQIAISLPPISIEY